MELPIWDSRAPTPQQQSNSSSNTNTQQDVHKLSPDNYQDTICFLEDYGLIICKQHCTAVVNLNTHLRDKHTTTPALRRYIVEEFSNFTVIEPTAVKLPEQPARALKELGTPSNGLKCKICEYLTISSDAIRKHCKKNHPQAWKNEKISLVESVKVQTFFRTGGLQKYFIVAVGVAENVENTVKLGVVERQLQNYQQVRQQLTDAEMIVGETAKTEKTHWFKRTGWPEHFKDRNLVHLAHQIRLPDKEEPKLQLAAKLTEQLIENCVKNLTTLLREIRQ
jgi:hypothetical protein